jgi:twitching motility protein PilI
MTEPQGAFAVLAGLAAQSRRHARGLPAQQEIKAYWNGIGFSLLDRRFVVPMGQVAEMLEVPGFTRLPGVRPWVRGVANVRGRLLPILDLAAFLGGYLTAHRKKQRILVLETDTLYTGLLVDEVLGMQHFPVDTYFSAEAEANPRLEALVDGGYAHGGALWTVFHLLHLAADPEFVNAAVT